MLLLWGLKRPCLREMTHFHFFQALQPVFSTRFLFFRPSVETINTCVYLLLLHYWPHTRTVLPGFLVRAIVLTLTKEVSTDLCISAWGHRVSLLMQNPPPPLPHPGHMYPSSPIGISFWESAGINLTVWIEVSYDPEERNTHEWKLRFKMLISDFWYSCLIDTEIAVKDGKLCPLSLTFSGFLSLQFPKIFPVF